MPTYLVPSAASPTPNRKCHEKEPVHNAVSDVGLHGGLQP